MILAYYKKIRTKCDIEPSRKGNKNSPHGTESQKNKSLHKYKQNIEI